MRTANTLSVLLVMSAILTSSIFAQSNASATSTIKAQLKKGLSISNLNGNLDFGEIVVTASAQNPNIANASGVEFEVVGHPAKNITITFAGINLTNNAWVTANGGTNSTIAFTPSVESTGGSITYASPASVSSGNVIPLVATSPVSGLGKLYLWLGGSLAIASGQAQGDYTGTFTMTVAY
jgi:hypothetical protein